MDFDLEKVINHRIGMLALLMKRQVIKLIADHKLDITPEQWVVMFYLWQENGLSIGDIARRSKKDFANVTRIVDKLKKMGYVDKIKNKRDSRIFHVFIQPEADEIRSDIQDCWKQASDIALKGISEAQQKKLMEFLLKMENNILNDLDK